MRILLWHVHGSWTTSFVQGPHEYVVPVLPDRGPDGVGRARTWSWPSSVVELPPEQLSGESFDLVVLQRPHELRLVEEWTGRRPGLDLPALYLEHNTPPEASSSAAHPMSGAGIPIVHVTHFNALFWDCGAARTTVIEHGVVDPGSRYTGEIAHAAVVTNDPVRRWRTVGADLLAPLSAAAPIDVFGMRVDQLPAATGLPPHRLRPYEDLPQAAMHAELARRRVYVHTTRWTSLGLALLEAMHLGMPVVALATTEAPRAVPASAGVVTASVAEMTVAIGRLIADPETAQLLGKGAREAVAARYSLERFLDDWETLLQRVA